MKAESDRVTQENDEAGRVEPASHVVVPPDDLAALIDLVRRIEELLRLAESRALVRP